MLLNNNKNQTVINLIDFKMFVKLLSENRSFEAQTTTATTATTTTNSKKLKTSLIENQHQNTKTNSYLYPFFEMKPSKKNTFLNLSLNLCGAIVGLFDVLVSILVLGSTTITGIFEFCICLCICMFLYVCFWMFMLYI